MNIHSSYFLFCAICVSSLTHAEATPGLEEYNSAIEIRDAIQPLLEELMQLPKTDLNSSPNLEKAKKIEKTRIAYRQQLEASASYGFAPAQYQLAQLIGSNTSTMYKKKNRACKLIEQAASSGLLAAVHGKFMHCSRPGILFGFGSEETNEALLPLAQTLATNDPFEKFYPFRTLKASICYKPDHTYPDLDTAKSMNPC